VSLAGAGRDNRFGFPHASVVSRYLRAGAAFYWTGRHGAIRACTDGWSLQVERQLRGQLDWEPLREWDPEEIDRWWRGQTTRKARPRPFAGPPKVRAPVIRSELPAESGEEVQHSPGADEWITDKQWDRRRRQRRKLKKPW